MKPIAGYDDNVVVNKEEYEQLQAENKRANELLHRFRICKSCGKQLSVREAESVHTCFDKQTLEDAK